MQATRSKSSPKSLLTLHASLSLILQRLCPVSSATQWCPWLPHHHQPGHRVLCAVALPTLKLARLGQVRSIEAFLKRSHRGSSANSMWRLLSNISSSPSRWITMTAKRKGRAANLWNILLDTGPVSMHCALLLSTNTPSGYSAIPFSKIICTLYSVSWCCPSGWLFH